MYQIFLSLKIQFIMKTLVRIVQSVITCTRVRKKDPKHTRYGLIQIVYVKKCLLTFTSLNAEFTQ